MSRQPTLSFVILWIARQSFYDFVFGHDARKRFDERIALVSGYFLFDVRGPGLTPLADKHFWRCSGRE
jgi:hypothetical protein